MNEQLPPLPPIDDYLPTDGPRWTTVNFIACVKRYATDYARAALAAKGPAGYKLVPIEPTEGILRALTDPFIAINGDNRKAFAKAWAAMLSAAPAPAPEAAKVPADPHLMTKHNALHMNHIALKAHADRLARALHTGLGALICAGSNNECQSLEVYAKQVMREALVAYDAAAPAPEADKPCLISGTCKHGNWCSEVYCQEHCKFVKEGVLPNGLTEAETSASPSVAGLGAPAQAQQASETVWVRDQRGDFAGRQTLDPLVILGSVKPQTGLHGATYSPFVSAKPEAQQPLTYELIADMLQDRARDSKEMHDFARAVEKACAEAWGVTLAGIGSSGEK